MPFDFKKEYKSLYLPGTAPEIIKVPPMNYAAVRGRGDPNEAGGAYQQAIGILYAVSYTIRMSPKSGRTIEGFFEYVVPPLEGFWRQDGTETVDYADKSGFCWVSLIRLPDFVSQADFEWAAAEAGRKKRLDCSPAEFITVDEGLCVQLLHRGSYDGEPESVARMNRFLAENGWQSDLSESRLHHEIYLSDPRKTAPERLKTVIRHPIKKR